MAKISDQKSDSSQLLSASRVASQVPCEPKSSFPKQMWRTNQKALYEALGITTPQVHFSREEKGKMPVCFVETVSRKVTTTTIPSSNSEAVTPRASLVLMREATDGVASTVPQGTHEVRSCEAGTKAPQCASLPSSSIKLALRSQAKGLPLSADSGAYAASAPKGIFKAFSRKFRAKTLSRANHLRSNIADKAPQC